MKKLKIKDSFLNHIEDFLILTGLILIILATFIVNLIAGIYVIGTVLLLLGIYFTKYTIKGR